MAADKDTVYIDIDDEITGIIDKVKASDSKVVALVLPKRAGVFQSIVNMKLLKRAADSSKKNVVLITSEAGLLPLAGAAGLHVAKTLTSKPEIPSAPDAPVEDDEAIPEEDGQEDVPVDQAAAVGTLAGAKATDDGVETLVLDDEDLPPEADGKPVPKTFEPPAKNKKLAVPNFERFRLLLIGGGVLLLLLIIGLVFATVALPKATISIKTNASNVDVGFGLALSTDAKTLDPETGVIPAKLASVQKVYTQQVPTTGQKNNGNKASGSVVVTNCSKSDNEHTLPAGTGFSSNGNTYISQETVTVPPSDFSGGGACKNNGKASVSVLAQSGGTGYNLPAGASFTVASNPGYLSATGGTMSGGTDNIVQSVNQNDITNARNKIVVNEAEIKKALRDQLKKDDYYVIEATYSAAQPAETLSARVGEVANNVTVTQNVTYTIFGVPKEDLQTMITEDINKQIDEDQQSVLDNGLAKAVFNVDALSATGAQVSFSAVATVGPDLNINEIKRNAAGKKAGAIKADLGNNPDVTDVEVKLSPFWVSSVPNKLDRITVEIAKPDSGAKASNSNGDNP